MNETEMKEKEALSSLERWCSGAEHCCSEARRKLESAGLAPESVDKILNRLLEDGYIDEKRYAAAFVHDKVNFAGWGMVKIRYQLKMKQIPDALIQDALAETDLESYMQRLELAVRSSLRTQKGRTPYERTMKTMKSVAGKGFEIPLIRDVLAKLTGNDLDFQD